MDTKENISKKLKKYRNQYNLSQDEFAYQVGVARNTISRIENCENFPSIESVDKICKYLNITYEEFLEPAKTQSDLYNIVNAKIRNLDIDKLKLVNKFIDTITAD